MNYCPCCSHQMLRHIRSDQTYWFCRRCWSEMPDLKIVSSRNTITKKNLVIDRNKNSRYVVSH